MRMSEFWVLMDDEFGPSYSRVLARNHVIHALGDLTAEQALEAQRRPRDVWLALCDDMGVPPERRLGVDRPVRDNPREP
ncbi:DUF3046 domain-containing protein [Luteipulveratus sp. YIM 133132]|uniref:DUF3046 domain-containing protein n=1 Tax=Luteipulveratus flavus TaxID=3031728 RepID=A0ABT6C911_9MICO|nr:MULTISPECIES: DUF3046 domain-containing protein [unclassified Luteipulveratus]MDE9366196.1 DUF3046 domain-containing protein [Luteipulveratus sp. YIM 133132]MDF8265285.1 DUF3046 domain-containing protein [Luteipulveratus sp. YIM 133296]